MSFAFATREEPDEAEMRRALELQEQRGGRIVAYQRVWSALAITVSRQRIEWVRDGESRVRAGLSHSGFTVLLGWWSIWGFFWTIGALIQNSLGGVDVTPGPEPGSDGVASGPGASEERRLERIQQVVYALVLLLLLGLAVRLIAVPALRQEGVL